MYDNLLFKLYRLKLLDKQFLYFSTFWFKFQKYYYLHFL